MHPRISSSLILRPSNLPQWRSFHSKANWQVRKIWTIPWTIPKAFSQKIHSSQSDTVAESNTASLMPQCIMRALLIHTWELHNTIKFVEQYVEPIEPTVAHTIDLSFNFPICKMNMEKVNPWSFARGEAGSWVLVLSAFSLSNIWIFYNTTSTICTVLARPLIYNLSHRRRLQPRTGPWGT